MAEKSESSCSTDRLFDTNCVRASNLRERKRSKKGIDPDVAVRLLSNRGYDVDTDQVFRITQGTQDHLDDEENFSNFISEEGFQRIVADLRRQRERKQKGTKGGRRRSKSIATQPWFKKTKSIQALQAILDVPEQKAKAMVNQCLSVTMETPRVERT